MEVSAADSLDILRTRHNKERKDLQAKITALKHGVQKNDKKRKKEVVQQCEKMEIEMKEKQEKEMEELQMKNGMERMILGEENGTNTENETKKADEETYSRKKSEEAEKDEKCAETAAPFFKETKLSKAQQKKERKRAEKADARSKAAAADEAEAAYSQGTMEREAMERVLESRGRCLVEVAPDGDCLYSALAHQTAQFAASKHSASDLRQIAADYIRAHQMDFLPFLTDSNGDPLDEFAFDEYCFKVARMCTSGGSWGGEAELRALSSALNRRIEVWHANGRVNVFGEELPDASSSPLVVTYHKFAYTLGEHYNATKSTNK